MGREMSTTHTLAERRRRTEGALLRIEDHLRAALEDIRDGIKYAPGPMTRDQLGLIELSVTQAREMLALVVA